MCQAFYMQKMIIWVVILCSMDGWSSQIAEWIKQSTAKLLLIRKYMIDICRRAEEQSQKFSLIQHHYLNNKKIILITQTIAEILLELNQTIAHHHKYSTILQMPPPINHHSLIFKHRSLQSQILNIPPPPYLNFNIHPQQHIIVLNPQHILYTHDKKKSCMIIKTYAQQIVLQLSKIGKVVIFMDRNIQQMNGWLSIWQKGVISQVLDKNFMSYRQCVRVKDLNKLGPKPQKIWVIDVDFIKYEDNPNIIQISKESSQQHLWEIVDQLKQNISASSNNNQHQS